ncbi:MAG: VOC family protein [SAR324 cluster bacterium]|nr:VOC family protein [SAR324 cluster bacterium]
MKYSVHHLHLICKDLEKMIVFFTEALDARLIVRKKFGTADGASLDLQGSLINLRVARDDETMTGDALQPRYGYDHLALEVENLEAAYQDLTSKGFSFVLPPTETPDAKIAFFKGAENITIELLQMNH